MEPVLEDHTPLADYLIGEGEGDASDWNTPDLEPDLSSPPSSPGFAPKGRPTVRSRFRPNAPPPLNVIIPKRTPLGRLRSKYSSVVASHIDQADNTKFLERFRYTIVASQLLAGHLGFSQNTFVAHGAESTTGDGQNNDLPPDPSVLFSVTGTILVAFIAAWMAAGGYESLTKRRLIFLAFVLTLVILVAPVYFKRQWLRYRRDQALSEVSDFVSISQGLDSAIGAAVSLIQEVELVSRGYRISTPLPPISRIEDRSQTRRCLRLRKALRMCFSDTINTYCHASTVVRGFSEQLDFEKYCDIYDISDFDMSDATLGYSEEEFDDLESLRTLKVLAARFYTVRKIFLCALLAQEANTENNDLLRWTTAVEALKSLRETTAGAYERLRAILVEEESFPNPTTPKLPLTPNRERWRSQLRKIGSLSTGIRGLQAKLHLLREESDRALDSSSDITELGPTLMSQYDSIGADLKDLVQAWEEGRAALALGIDRNEKRLSSMSTLISPVSSLNGLTTVDEGTVQDALKILNGESPPSASDYPSNDVEEVFEAMALPRSRPRSLLTRDERIAKMKDERERKEAARERAEASRGMLRELETVINLRPRKRQSEPASRVVSM
ncbi:uncharacterized protein DNG_00573 [Cephalotrichum gorgonifer]|uniref:Vezatin n=1 Tax=Cephalotrichum gorgonifer TaxID=2041049 RepID=A0AAE8SR04_9PEZI|nr:uncharacterized protein DNG_00573 [Cephalotrichum gorgonifer]